LAAASHGPPSLYPVAPADGPFKEPRCGPRPGVAYAHTPARRQLGVAASGPRAIERRLARFGSGASRSPFQEQLAEVALALAEAA
jgi:hypothetical protein